MKVINTKFRLVTILIMVFIFNACQQKNKQQHHKKPVKKQPVTVSEVTQDVIPDMPRDSISLFTLAELIISKGDTAAFVSVSDIDRFPGNDNSPEDSIDRIVIPSLENKKAEATRYFSLQSKYRKRLLDGTGISENDSLFVYNYKNNILVSFAINSLDAVAELNYYEDATIAQHSARSYMLGFKIDREALKRINDRYSLNTYVYIGTKNPFVKGQMQPIIWKITDPKNFPTIPLHKQEKEILKGFDLTGTYKFKTDDHSFYLQEYSKSESSPCERLIICDNNGKVISNDLLSDTESTSPAPLSFVGNNTHPHEQWTGRLLKNRPPLLFGFEYVSFGCPLLFYTDRSLGVVEINCDNRH